MTECCNVIFITIAYSRVRWNDEEKYYYLKSAKSDDFQKFFLCSLCNLCAFCDEFFFETLANRTLAVKLIDELKSADNCNYLSHYKSFKAAGTSITLV